MNSFLKKFRGFIAFFSIVSVGILALFYSALKPQQRLPVYQPSMVNYELVDSTLQHVKKFHRIASFSLTNQNGETVTDQDYKDKIYVADFFFTTCPTICPKMTDNMGQLQSEFLEDPQIKFLSHSVTPQIDSVQQLKKYALDKGVNDSKWNLVTGNKKVIYSLARKSYLAVKDDGDGGPFDMIHTENFILVDPEKRIRGFYDGTDLEAMQTLIADISILKEEYPQE